ncbi:MAG TPA: hypothetical protein VNA28_13300 [Solirubrobacteraceae bacterium]|nr:hypothetical protein [Solirubrobacteraceae bacterium]
MAGGPRVIAYKFLRDGQVGPFSGVPWPPAGEWLQATEVGDCARACLGRVHACRVEDLPEWMDHELWRVELDGHVTVDCGKLIADRGRLVERVEVWDAALMAAFAEACALRARDAALTVLAPGSPAHCGLASCHAAEDLAAACVQLTDLDPDGERAAGYAGDAARHVLGAVAEPSTAPIHAAVNGFIAAHAAAFAENDLGAAERERAWQADWLARRLEITA